MRDARELLRKLSSLTGPLPSFDTFVSASTPQAQFLAWLDQAIAVGVQEPHAMTLSTVNDDGHPDVRALILKDLDEQGWHFAASAASPKKVHLSRHPEAAPTFSWSKVGRQVRTRGTAIAQDGERNAADFRPQGSRAGTLLARQSDIPASAGDLDVALSKQYERMARQPDLIAPA